MPDPERIAYRLDEAARLVGVGRPMLYDAIKRGDLAAKRTAVGPRGGPLVAS